MGNPGDLKTHINLDLDSVDMSSQKSVIALLSLKYSYQEVKRKIRPK